MSELNGLASGTLTSIREEIIQALFARFDGTVPRQTKTKKRGKPGHRLTVIFAATLKGLKGMKYCSYLDNHRIKPKWSEDQAPPSYPQGYKLGQPWRKKIQDEKTRAKAAMTKYEQSVLSNAFVTYMSAEFGEIGALLCSRNSQNASKKIVPPQTP